MCTTCGCSDEAEVTITDLESGKTVGLERGHHHHHGDGNYHHHHDHGDGHHHHHDHGDGHHHHHHHDHGDGHHHHHHDHGHGHAHEQAHEQAAAMHGTTISLEQEILAKNNRIALGNREDFAVRNILALNLVSSPGSGKTSLLERTIQDLGGDLPIGVVEGDQATVNDSARIRATGCPVVQINTGTGCHLEADMLMRGLEQLQPPRDSVVMIENVGNLVCPALFDLGERCKVAILSVTEGEDKPIKYPHMFAAAELLLLNKIDLLPHLNFDVDACIEHARSVNPHIEILLVSATTGEGMQAWYDWIRGQIESAANRAVEVPEVAG